jgi:hypothetical protein
MSHIIQSNLTTIMWRQFFRLRKNKKKPFHTEQLMYFVGALCQNDIYVV